MLYSAFEIAPSDLSFLNAGVGDLIKCLSTLGGGNIGLALPEVLVTFAALAGGGGCVCTSPSIRMHCNLSLWLATMALPGGNKTPVHAEIQRAVQLVQATLREAQASCNVAPAQQFTLLGGSKTLEALLRELAQRPDVGALYCPDEVQGLLDSLMGGYKVGSKQSMDKSVLLSIFSGGRAVHAAAMAPVAWCSQQSAAGRSVHAAAIARVWPAGGSGGLAVAPVSGGGLPKPDCSLPARPPPRC